MTNEEKRLAVQIATDLEKSLNESFVGKSNSTVTRANVTAFLQNKINEMYESLNLEFASLPTIDVQIDGNLMTIKFFDPETKKEVSLGQWMDSYNGRTHGRRY